MRIWSCRDYYTIVRPTRPVQLGTFGRSSGSRCRPRGESMKAAGLSWVRLGVLPMRQLPRDPPHATINRLCAPSSELAIEKRWYPATNRHCAHVAGVRANNRCKLARCLITSATLVPLPCEVWTRQGFIDPAR